VHAGPACRLRPRGRRRRRRAWQLALVIFDELNQADAGRVRGKLAGFDRSGP